MGARHVFDSVQQVGAGISAPALVTPANAFDVGLGFVVVSGVSNCDVEFCFREPTDALVVWYKHPTLVNLAANAAGNAIVPVVAFRLNQTGAGTVRLDILQDV